MEQIQAVFKKIISTIKVDTISNIRYMHSILSDEKLGKGRRERSYEQFIRFIEYNSEKGPVFLYPDCFNLNNKDLELIKKFNLLPANEKQFYQDFIELVWKQSYNFEEIYGSIERQDNLDKEQIMEALASHIPADKKLIIRKILFDDIEYPCKSDKIKALIYEDLKVDTVTAILSKRQESICARSYVLTTAKKQFPNQYFV